MLELTVRPQARRDLREIWSYTRRRWSREQADRYIARLRAAISELRNHPDLGRPSNEVRPGLLRRLAERHVIYFRVTDERLLVVRILHGRMDPALHLANDDM